VLAPLTLPGDGLPHGSNKLEFVPVDGAQPAADVVAAAIPQPRAVTGESALGLWED
jgi:hypothetical protein